MKEKSYSLTFDCVWIAANLLLCSVAFSQSPTHADVTYGAGQEVVDMYLAKSPAPTPIYIWGHAKGQTYKRVSKDAVSLCLDAGYSFLSIEANDDNNDGIQDLYFKEPWLKILDFVIANAARYNIDPENIFIGGRSLGSIGSFPAAMERWEDVRGVYSMQALPTGGKPHAALVGKNSPPCHLIYRGAPGNGNHDPLNGIMVQEAYRNAGIADRFVIKTETRDRQWFDGFVEFVQTNRIGGKGDQQRATQAALKRKSRETSAGIKPTYTERQRPANTITKEQRITNWLRSQDKNGDGKIARDEATGLMKSNFTRNDTNKDNVVDRDELGKVADRLARGGYGRNRQPRNQQTMTTEQSRYRFRVRDNMHQDIERTLQNSPWKTPVYEVLVRSFDGLYVPAVLIKPGDDSAKYAVIILLYAGSRGMDQLHKDLAVNRGMLAERLLQEGYAVCTPGCRVEMDDTYVDPNFPAVLDHHDVMAVIEYLKRRKDIDPDRIGLYGVSHGGELICKITAEMDLAGAVAVEPANIDFLNYPRMGRGPDIDERKPLKDSQYDRAFAMERIRKIKTPVVILNRTNDHLTGIFKTTYQLMRQAGVPCWEWEFEHPRHGFSWGPRKKNGAYNPHTVQQKALEQTIEFFNTYVMRMKKLE